MSGYSGSELSAEDVRLILDLVERSSFESFDLRIGELHLSVSKTGAATGVERPAARSLPPSAAAETSPPVPMVAPAAAVPAPTPEAGDAAGEDADLMEVTAPIVGIFYVAPEPGAKPFVEVGSEIDVDATVGLIEVMKVFNGVKAGVAGTVVKRLVEDSSFVEHGQALFLVRPRVP